LDESEFKTIHPTLPPNLNIPKEKLQMPSNKLMLKNGTPIDWHKNGHMNPIRNQQSCGGCYSFAAIAAVEGLYHKIKGSLIELSD